MIVGVGVGTGVRVKMCEDRECWGWEARCRYGSFTLLCARSVALGLSPCLLLFLKVTYVIFDI